MVRQRRLVPALSNASGTAPLILGNLLEVVTTSALSRFQIYSDNNDLTKHIPNFRAQQDTFVEATKTVKTAKDNKINHPAPEIEKTQENVTGL